jgi:C-terminal processing protease CtpA/Prc
VVFSVLVSCFAFAAPLSFEQKVEELLSLHSTIKSQYAPLEYKNQFLHESMDSLLSRYMRLAEATDNVGFYYLINRYVAAFNDSHFSARLQTNRLASLGFSLDRVQGSAVIDEIDRKVLPESAFPLQRGDELVALNGESVENIVVDLAKYFGMGNPESSRRVATMFLSYRPGSMVPVPTGKVRAKFRKSDKTEKTVDLEWRVTGDPIDVQDGRGLSLRQLDYASISVEDIFEELPASERSYWCSGRTRIAIPEGAVHLMREPFVAYYHPTAKGNIGYLRIPHYSWHNAAIGADESELRLQQYEWVIDELEKHTAGLVIDQDHNCGGSVFFLESMVTLFADKPFVGLQFQFLTSRSEYLEFKGWLTSGFESTLLGADTAKILDLMKLAASEGKRLTQKTSVRNNRLLQPNSVRYTKPVVLLTDEMSGSGGDAFPAMMQGLGRAKIMGSRTMGAGGHVEEFAPLNYSASKLRMTKSLFYHPNGTAIENNGVTPDIAYAITHADFIGEYKPYQAAYLKELMALIP